MPAPRPRSGDHPGGDAGGGARRRPRRSALQAPQISSWCWTSARSTCPTGRAYHLCGPLPFVEALRSALVDHGVAPRDIQYEVFGPDLWQADFRTEPAPRTHAYA